MSEHLFTPEAGLGNVFSPFVIRSEISYYPFTADLHSGAPHPIDAASDPRNLYGRHSPVAQINAPRLIDYLGPHVRSANPSHFQLPLSFGLDTHSFS